jgi:hypothetical protein
MVVFQGHQIFPGGLFLDVLFSLWPLVFIFLKLTGHLPKIGKNMSLLDFFMVYLFILFIPNSTYGFLEIKHLLVLDHVADSPDIYSWLIFGGVSLFCLACTLIGNYLIVRHYAKSKKEIFIYYLVLGLSAGFGSAIGLLDFYSFAGLVPTLFPQIFQALFSIPALIHLALGVSALIFTIGYLTHRFVFKPSFN